jgi:predicted ribosomally synthesized peptide with SipW-like signal peptide
MTPRRSRLLALLALAVAATVLAGGGGTWAAFSSTTSTSVSTLSSAPDWTAPTISASVIGKTAGGNTGSIKQGGTYYVYANITDSGNPASGISTATANVSNITTGQTAVALTTTSCPCTAGGVTYTHRSASITANASLTAGSKSYTVSANDVAANGPTSGNYSVTVDNTVPTATDIQTTNLGATAGKPELGDKVTFTYSELIDPNSLLAGWTGSSQNVVLRISNAGAGNNDVVTIRNAANTAQLPFGTVNLGRSGYVATGATVNFGATGTASTMVQSAGVVTITLGTASGTTNTVSNKTAMSWTPSPTATDVAGNAASTTAAPETGTSDAEF